MMKKISIITPCFNAEKVIAETVGSVLTQTALASNRTKLEYIICDGASSDKTAKIIKSFKNTSIQLISGEDDGMYHALAKGLQKATGDIVAYLNAGDYYHKCAFDVVLDLFEKREVHWLTGYNVTCNARSHVTGFNLPYRYRKAFFDCGIYGNSLPFVEQESTFWSSELNNLIDFERLARFKFAGDFYLWANFSKERDLKIVEAYLGGFKRHKGQISEDRESYYNEMKSLTRKPTPLEYLLAWIDKSIWFSYPTFKKILNNKGIFRYNHDLQRWM